MKSNKSIVIFLLKFFGTYALLFFLYSYYLDSTQIKFPDFRCAPITKSVAEQSASIINVLGYECYIEQHATELSFKLYVNEKYISRIVEGCSSIAIIILFSSFIVAFSGRFLPTVLYIAFGSVIIYYFNIFRIALIAIGLYEFPKYDHFLHDILFPLLIYGMTFILWVFWVKIVSKKAK